MADYCGSATSPHVWIPLLGGIRVDFDICRVCHLTRVRRLVARAAAL